MKKAKNIFPIIISLIVFQSCNTTEPDGFSQSFTGINFSVSELHYQYGITEKPKIYLDLSTTDIYGCYNYGLNTGISFANNNINVTINDLIIPGICATALGPATSQILLDIPDGVYNLNIYTGRYQNRYQLKITASEIVVNEISSRNSNPIYTCFLRYPQKSFVYMCGSLVEDKYICDDFLDTLKSKINITEFFFPDEGMKPYPEKSDGHYYDMSARYFIYESEEEYSKIGNIMSGYKKTVLKDKQGVGISTTNWMNKYFYSWLY